MDNTNIKEPVLPILISGKAAADGTGLYAILSMLISYKH
jgi:hypothetical protein